MQVVSAQYKNEGKKKDFIVTFNLLQKLVSTAEADRLLRSPFGQIPWQSSDTIPAHE